MGFFKEKMIFSYHRCSACGALYAPEFFDQRQLADLYAQMPPNMELVPMTALRATQRGYHEAIHGCKLPSGGYLEVGPDIGLFTEHCVADSTFDRFWLFEPNVAVKPQLEKLMTGREWHLSHELLDFSIVPKQSISLAVMIHVLDHLLDPGETLRRIRSVMIPRDSLLLIVTHDEGSLLARLLGSRWPAFCLQHPQLYNRRSIRAQLDAAGLETVACIKTTNHFPANFLLRHLFWSLGLSIPNLPSIGEAILGLRLGNMLTLARPKG